MHIDPINDPNDDKAKGHNLPLRKERVLQPLSVPITKKDIPGASDDLLAELRKKTAALTDKMAHKEDDATYKTLTIDSNSGGSEHPQPIEETPEAVPKPLGIKKDAGDPAVSLVRDKLSRLYKKEPDASEEAIESYHAGNKRSKHQTFMYELTTSGKSLADIQTEWHTYYVTLPEVDKHDVWNEFYGMQRQTSKMSNAQMQPRAAVHQPAPQAAHKSKMPTAQPEDPRTVGEIKGQLMKTVSGGGKLTAVHHFKSLLFGLGLAGLVGLIITFTFFNEVFIAPFISPSRSVSATPIIGDQTGPVGPEPKIIIPKINLEVPVVFDLGTIAEKDIQNALEDGVVHYSTTPNPGENGNSVIVGHSSNNILNSGKYKFAFVLLKRLEKEDTFFVHKDGVRYTYKIFKKEIVPPSDVSVLQTQERSNTITLITCDPPGTSLNRLIIVAEQISPDISGNTVSTAPTDIEVTETKLPSNSPSLWSRLSPF